MKLTTEVRVLAGALAFAAKAASVRPPNPILSHVRIEVGDGALTLTATNLDLVHRASVAIEDGKPGVAVAPAARLAGLAAGLPADAAVTLELKDARLRIASGRGRWVLPILSIDEFPPPLVLADDATRFTLRAATARLLVRRLRWAISTEETRYYLCGMNLWRRAGKLVAAATTGHVLAELALDIDVGRDLNVIVPVRAIDTLQTLVRAGDIDVRADAAKIEFSCGPFSATSKLIDATFPDYERLLPEASINRIVVKSADLLAAVERLKSVDDPDKMGVIVGLYWNENPTLEACLAYAEENSEAIDATVSGGGCVAAQAEYLIEALEALGTESVCLDYGTPGNPIIITAPDDSAYLALVMPASAPAWSRERRQKSAA